MRASRSLALGVPDIQDAEPALQSQPPVNSTIFRTLLWTTACLAFAVGRVTGTDEGTSQRPKIATYRLVEIINRVQPEGVAVFFWPAEKRDEYKRLQDRQRALAAAIFDTPRTPGDFGPQLRQDMDEIGLIRGQLDLLRQTFGWHGSSEEESKILEYLRTNYLPEYRLIIEEQTWSALKDQFSESMVGDIEVVDLTPEVIKTMLEATGRADPGSPRGDIR